MIVDKKNQTIKIVKKDVLERLKGNFLREKQGDELEMLFPHITRIREHMFKLTLRFYGND